MFFSSGKKKPFQGGEGLNVFGVIFFRVRVALYASKLIMQHFINNKLTFLFVWVARVGINQISHEQGIV